MKKIYYLMAIASVFIYSCRPLDKTYQSLDASPAIKTMNFTLSTADYGTLASGYPKTTFLIDNDHDANIYIPAILTAKYTVGIPDNTPANITYTGSPSYSSILLPDSVYTHIASTLTTADYALGGSSATLTSAQVLTYLAAKYPTPVTNQLVVITYNYSETNVTPAAGLLTTDSYMYMNRTWAKLYTISNAQYASVNRGTNNYFIGSTDAPNLVGYINTFLKSDPTVATTATTGAVKYVSYRVLTSTATAAVNAQLIMILTFDGSNWVEKTTLPYIKIGGIWKPNPTIYVIEPDGANNPDYAYIATTSFGSLAARTNLASYGDFYISSSYWADADIQSALAALLAYKFPKALPGSTYQVSYVVYKAAAPATKTYLFDGTTWTFLY